MSVTLAQINEKYNDETYPVFPFISKNRITVLTKGLYRKHKATFRGVTATYDSDNQKYRYPLYGMYNIEENLIVVPEGLAMTPSKQSFLDFYLGEEYTQIAAAPKFKTLYFEEDSQEAELALANKIEHQTREKLNEQVSITVPNESDSTTADIENLLNH